MKILITKDNIDTRISPADHRFYADSGIILTPGAKDELKKRNIRIVYAPMPNVDACERVSCAEASHSDTTEKAARCVATLLKERCNIDDPELIRQIVSKALLSLKQG